MRRLIALVLFAYILVLGRVTLGPTSTPAGAVKKTATQIDRATEAGGDESPRSSKPERKAVDTAFNVALFVPFGALLLGLEPSWRWWVVVGAGGTLSAVIELSQRWLFTWRTDQLSDLGTNTVGTAIGWAVVAAALRYRSGAGVSSRSGPG